MSAKETRRDTRRRPGYSSLCRQRIRQAWLLGKVCVQCGSTDNLEPHHIDPSTKDDRLRRDGKSIWSLKKQDREIELAKCEVRCKPCHQIAHGKGQTARPHGTISRYTNQKCRCLDCKAAWSRYQHTKYMSKLALLQGVSYGG